MSRKSAFIFLLTYLPAVLAVFPCTAQQVVINELASQNPGTLTDEDGDSPDWVELYNRGDLPLSLHQWSLTDEPAEQPRKWRFPDINIPPNGYLLVFLSGKDRAGDTLHTSFSLGAGREPLHLLRADGTTADRYAPDCIPEGMSYGLQPDGNGLPAIFTSPSPGQSNNGQLEYQVPVRPDSLSFSRQSGFYNQEFLLKITNSDPRNVIRYTLDGSPPTANSPVYNGPLRIRDRTGDKNQLSDINTGGTWFKEPAGPVYKGTVVRAAAYSGRCPATPVRTRTFFVSPNARQRYQLAVVALATSEDNFFNDDD